MKKQKRSNPHLYKKKPLKEKVDRTLERAIMRALQQYKNQLDLELFGNSLLSIGMDIFGSSEEAKRIQRARMMMKSTFIREYEDLSNNIQNIFYDYYLNH